MKSSVEIRQQRRLATVRSNLAEMRGSAMDYRVAIAPDTDRNLVQRGNDGVHSLGLAVNYRDMARNMGRWAPERAHADLQMSWEGGAD